MDNKSTPAILIVDDLREEAYQLLGDQRGTINDEIDRWDALCRKATRWWLEREREDPTGPYEDTTLARLIKLLG